MINVKEVSASYLMILHVLEGYLSNNYSYRKLSENLHCPFQTVNQILYDKKTIEKYFGLQVCNFLSDHKEIIKRYNSIGGKNLYVLDSVHLQIRTLLENPNDNSLQFTKNEVLSLSILRLCYIFDGDLGKVAQNLRIPIDSVIAYLNAPFLEHVLSKSAYVFWQEILKFSFLYSYVSAQGRKDFIKYIFDTFVYFRGSLKKMHAATGISIVMLRNILSDNGAMVLADCTIAQKQWILNQLHSQEYLLDNLQTAVEDKILLERRNLYQTGKDLSISKYKVRKLVKEDIPQKNPIRGILIDGVLSTLDS